MMVLELSAKSWLLGARVPGLSRLSHYPLKPSADDVCDLLGKMTERAAAQGKTVTRLRAPEGTALPAGRIRGWTGCPSSHDEQLALDHSGKIRLDSEILIRGQSVFIPVIPTSLKAHPYPRRARSALRCGRNGRWIPAHRFEHVSVIRLAGITCNPSTERSSFARLFTRLPCCSSALPAMQVASTPQSLRFDAGIIPPRPSPRPAAGRCRTWFPDRAPSAPGYLRHGRQRWPGRWPDPGRCRGRRLWW